MPDEAVEQRPNLATVPVLAYALPETGVPDPEGHWTNFTAIAWLCGMCVRLLAAEVRGTGVGNVKGLIVGPLLVTLVGLLATMAAVGLVRRVARPMRLRLRNPRLAGVIGAAHAIVVVGAWSTLGQAPAELLTTKETAFLFAVLFVVPALAPLLLLRQAA